LERIEVQPSNETLAQIYGKQYYDAWDLGRNPESVREMKKATFRRTVSGADALRRGDKVLDCGAATGFLMEVAEEAGFEPYGIELSEFGASEIAKRFGADRVFQGQVEDAQFPGLADEPFAAVFMCDFLEHVRNPIAVLSRAHRLLRAGGTLVVCTPKLDSLSHRVMRASWTHYKLEHLYYFTTNALRLLLARTCFTNYREALPWKTMNLNYVQHQFECFPHRLAGPVVRSLARAVPSSAKRLGFPILMGEMLVYAQRS
jgi:2-polyprenyl-3-methyl-5-hydroxy-6-metoxy-1,4-benzoquinol methylase